MLSVKNSLNFGTAFGYVNRNHRWSYILSFRSAVILEVVGRWDRSHYPSIQVLDFGAAPPQTLGTRPIDEASRDAALEKEEEDGAESLPECPSLLGLAIAHLHVRNTGWTEFAYVTRKNINIWRFLRTNATFIFTFGIERRMDTCRISLRILKIRRSIYIYIYICRISS